MQLFILTYGRANNQTTYRNLSPALQQRTTFVVQKREAHLYKQDNILVLPPKIERIAPTRQWVLDYCMKNNIDKFVMLDDDLDFCTRRKDVPTKFIRCTDKELELCFKKLFFKLDNYAHVGVLAREGGNRVTTDQECHRMMRILGYNTAILKEHKIRFTRLEVMEDFDVTLQLLRLGYKNLVIGSWVQGQGSSGARGGCSHFRTLELHNENVIKLKALHPEFVTVREKTTKTAWGGATRLDVNVQWKKAYASSEGAQK